MSTFTADTLTQAVIASAANAPNARARTLFAAAVKHLHAFVREVELTPEELMAGIRFLTATGQMCDELRQEFILLSDTLGVTMMVDTVAHQNSGGATESSVLGPFFTTDAPDTATGESIASEEKGEPLLVHGVVRSVSGEPIAGAVLDVLGDRQRRAVRHAICRAPASRLSRPRANAGRRDVSFSRRRAGELSGPHRRSGREDAARGRPASVSARAPALRDLGRGIRTADDRTVRGR